MLDNQVLGAIFALGSALTYGSADFFGGVATKKNNPYSVLTLSSLLGAILLTMIAISRQEKLPGHSTIFWAILAGISGTIGLALLYQGLTMGNSAIVSPISGVVGASIPVLFTFLSHDIPSIIQSIGLCLAFPAIFMVSQSVGIKVESFGLRKNNLKKISIGFIAGLFFGFFFISIAQVHTTYFFAPLAISKLTSFIFSFLIILILHKPTPKLKENPAVLLAGILDPAANGLYLYSTSLTRLDIAVVLTSLYPAGTVLLAFGFQKEKITRYQWIGIGLCLVSIFLIMS